MQGKGSDWAKKKLKTHNPLNKSQICHLDITQIEANQTTLTFIIKTKSQICHIPNQIGPKLTLSIKPGKSQEHVEPLRCKNHKNMLGHETGHFNSYFESMADPISKPLMDFNSHASSDL